MRCRFAIAMVVLLAMSCGSAPHDLAEGYEVHLLGNLPAGEYGRMTWLPNGWIVTEYASSGAPQDERLWAFRRDGSDFHKLPLRTDPTCRLLRFGRPERLPDGRLGLQKECVGPAGSRADRESSYIAYDIEKDSEEQLAPLIPIEGRKEVAGALVGDVNIGTAAWKPDLSEALISTGSLCSTISRLTSNGYEAWPVEIVDDSRRWQLDAVLRLDGSESCAAFGRAGLPAMSPNGKRTAFFASPQAIGIDGPARFDKPWNLYTIDGSEEPRKLVSDVLYPTSLGWSPDDELLAFTGGIGGAKKGLWLVDAKTSNLEHVSSLELSEAAWDPEGRSIIVVEAESETRSSDGGSAPVRIIDVS